MRNKLLFIYPSRSTFILKDLEIIRKYFYVKTIEYNGKKDIPRLLFNILVTDLSLSWFVLDHSLFAVVFSKILGKKSIVIVGGWDVVDMPDINYGALRKDKNRLRVKLTFKLANTILAVSEFTKKEAINKIGIFKIKVLYHGFDANLYSSNKRIKEDIAITVGAVKFQNLKRKGLEIFVKSAKYLPDVDFVVIGKHLDESVDYLKSVASKNVEFKGFLNDEELIEYLNRSKVYVQVSAHEGFGCSLAEAMLCECAPVVTRNAAIPEVVGNTGLYTEYNKPKETAQKIDEALNSAMGKKARKRVETLYPIKKREKQIVSIINGLLN